MHTQTSLCLFFFHILAYLPLSCQEKVTLLWQIYGLVVWLWQGMGSELSKVGLPICWLTAAVSPLRCNSVTNTEHVVITSKVKEYSLIAYIQVQYHMCISGLIINLKFNRAALYKKTKHMWYQSWKSDKLHNLWGYQTDW